MNDAIAECNVYGKMGALNEEILNDIAHDNDVNINELKRAIEWD